MHRNVFSYRVRMLRRVLMVILAAALVLSLGMGVKWLNEAGRSSPVSEPAPVAPAEKL